MTLPKSILLNNLFAYIQAEREEAMKELSDIRQAGHYNTFAGGYESGQLTALDGIEDWLMELEDGEDG